MFGWNDPHSEAGMAVRRVHVLHVGHRSDGYCYPCTEAQPLCEGATAADGLCGRNSSGYQGYRAVIGARPTRAQARSQPAPSPLAPAQVQSTARRAR
jgi:hypothetical protein